MMNRDLLLPTSKTGTPVLYVRLAESVYRVERSFGELASASGTVTDVAVDRRGHVYVLFRRDSLTDLPQPSVFELAPDGRLLAAWGSDIADAHMLLCDPVTDTVLVVDRDAHHVRRYSAQGVLLSILGRPHRPGEPFSHPTDIAIMPDGTLIVTDGYGHAHVHLFTPHGTLMRTFGLLGNAPGEFLTPHSVCALGREDFVVCDRENHRLQVFHIDGSHEPVLEAVWGGFFRPQSVWSDGKGFLYVTDSVPSLSLLARSGERLARCRPVLNGAHGLCGNSASGEIYLAEGNPSRVTRLVPVPGF